ELIKQRRLRFLSRSQHQPIPPFDKRIESAVQAASKEEFFNKIRPSCGGKEGRKEVVLSSPG
ncbi:hypothetical protein, partial [Tritonibacter scottomollicae]|uniref:hypothetical protein n=1 Tax=Tritonibacter scottomollicae TaxID=483013 RepID=UPI003AA94A3C